MTKLFRIAATLTLALAASAGVAGEPAQTFRHDGVTYSFNTSALADGAKLIQGTTDAGDRFRLVVRNGRVTGQANQRPVSYSVASSRGAAGGAAILSAPVAKVVAAD